MNVQVMWNKYFLTVIINEVVLYSMYILAIYRPKPTRQSYICIMPHYIHSKLQSINKQIITVYYENLACTQKPQQVYCHVCPWLFSGPWLMCINLISLHNYHSINTVIKTCVLCCIKHLSDLGVFSSQVPVQLCHCWYKYKDRNHSQS